MKQATRQSWLLIGSPRRRGSALYMMVLSTALIVSLLGFVGMTLVRIDRQEVVISSELLEARANARSAVELALRELANDPNWRNTYTDEVESTQFSLGTNGKGTVSWILDDTDDDLTNGDVDLRLKGVGRVGNTVQVSSVKLSGTATVLDSLQCSVYALGNMTQNSNSTTNLGPFASDATISITGAVTGDVEGDPVVITGSVSGTTTDPGPDRGMPSPTVWDTYLALATTIPYTSFPLNPTDPNLREMDRNLIGATVNPYGPTDADGVYYIQIPAGKQLTILDSRIHATLLIELGDGATFNTSQSCLWDPYAGNNYPCAIVKAAGSANFELKSSPSNLMEGSQPKFNFNPGGEPYDGITDNDKNDQYPSLMRGLYHVIGSGVHTTLSVDLDLTGVLVTEGTVTLGANIAVTVNPSIYSNPPLGYSATTGDIEPVMGTWQWDATP